MPKVIESRQKMLDDAQAELVALNATIKSHRQEALRLHKRRPEALVLLGKPYCETGPGRFPDVSPSGLRKANTHE